METLERVIVSVAEGVHGDFRGGLAATRPGRKRQISILEAESWRAAMAEVEGHLEWWHSRRNLLLDGVNVPHTAGTRLAVGHGLIIEVTGECDPCARMDALHEGLRAALTPEWRGGFVGRVLVDGDIAVGDEVRIL